MIDLETASSDEIIAEAKETLTVLRNRKNLPENTALELTEWLFAYGIRLIKDMKGFKTKSEEEIDEEVKKSAESDW